MFKNDNRVTLRTEDPVQRLKKTNIKKTDVQSNVGKKINLSLRERDVSELPSYCLDDVEWQHSCPGSHFRKAANK